MNYHHGNGWNVLTIDGVLTAVDKRGQYYRYRGPGGWTMDMGMMGQVAVTPLPRGLGAALKGYHAALAAG